jgi:hypothetical protein
MDWKPETAAANSACGHMKHVVCESKMQNFDAARRVNDATVLDIMKFIIPSATNIITY